MADGELVQTQSWLQQANQPFIGAVDCATTTGG